MIKVIVFVLLAFISAFSAVVCVATVEGDLAISGVFGFVAFVTGAITRGMYKLSIARIDA